MKLQNLFEETVIVKKSFEELIDYLKQSKNQIITDIHHEIVYIISDLPPITWKQYDQLLDASFEPGSSSFRKSADGTRFHSPNLFDPRKMNSGPVGPVWRNSYEDYKRAFNSGRMSPVIILTWKEFVATMKDKYPLKFDDFEYIE